MKLLLTSDWQTQFNNLDLCKTALDELLAAASRYQPHAVVHLGDLKQQYNPVDVAVFQFWVAATRLIKQYDFPFFILLGNHDRVSQSWDSSNWLDVMKAAGATVITRPVVKKVHGYQLAFLPYTPDLKEEREWAAKLREDIESGPSILFFHTMLRGAVINSAGVTEQKANAGADLFVDKYDYAFGGHVHLHQRISGRVYYVGSPFCHDWGEANAKKGHLLVNTALDDVKQLVTKIPHWYDLEWLEENHVQPENGAYVRSKVPVTSKKIVGQLRAEEERLHNMNPNLRIFVVPQLKESEKMDVQFEDGTDDQKIAQYVTATMPEIARFKAGQAIAYMNYKLGNFKVQGDSNRALTFSEVSAWNVLCFRYVTVPLANQGLVLLRGVNKDWDNRSNGAGKSSTLALLLLALFGRPIKDQKHDSWAREECDESVCVRLKMEDARGRKLEVERWRPHSLIFRIDGEDRSLGIKGTGKDETQGMIEQTVGLDWRSTVNSIYIDQTVANGFVFGTQKDRMDLISKLQNLERFDAAQRAVNDDIKAREKAIDALMPEVGRFDERADRLMLLLRELELKRSTKWAIKLKMHRKDLERYARLLASYKDMAPMYKEKQDERDALAHDVKKAAGNLARCRGEIAFCEKQLQTARKLIEQKRCGVCQQPSTKAGNIQLAYYEERLKVATEALDKERHIETRLGKKIDGLEKDIQQYLDVQSDALERMNRTKDLLEQAEQAEQDERKEQLEYETKKRDVLAELNETNRYLKAVRGTLATYDIDLEMMEYARKAFSRSGMPLYLCAALCPVLNHAAEDYSEIFTGGAIKIRFSVEDGEFCVQIVNPAGSGAVEGQSVGEAAMAGIICAFAIREAASKTNVLILDEPGHGLDPEGARQFAEGLVKIKDRFSTILVTTHSPIIEAVLSGQRIWTVIKEDRISRLCMDR